MTATTPASRGPRQEPRTVVENRQARYLFSIEDNFTAGLMLEGWEVKAILAGQATFNGGGAFVRLKDGEAYLDSLTITPLLQSRKGLLEDLNPTRPRKLLLNRSEINKIQRRVAERGFTVVPLALTYNGRFKLEIGVAKGKKQADKRETLKARDGGRDLAREVKELRV